MDSFLQDLKYSVRQLLARPAFTVAAISVLALGIGAATSIFSVPDTLVLRALPALVLAAVGIYGVVSYMARTRTQEIGLRVALGAGHTDALREVMKKGVQLTSLGILIGLVGSLGLTTLMSDLLFGVGPHDPLTLLGVAAVLAVIALVAMYVPARRAATVDPALALRGQ